MRLSGQIPCLPHDPSDVDAVWRSLLVRDDPVGGAAEEGLGTACVSTAEMGYPYGDLSEAPPELPFGLGGSLPGRLQHLMSVKRAVGVEKALRLDQGFGRWHVEVVRHRGYAGRAVR
jgi:hypothetical protein